MSEAKKRVLAELDRRAMLSVRPAAPSREAVAAELIRCRYGDPESGARAVAHARSFCTNIWREAEHTADAILTLFAAQPGEATTAQPKQCERCQGNGEIVTDWDRYKHPRPGDVGDEAVAECPDCNGEGDIATPPDTAALLEKAEKALGGLLGIAEDEGIVGDDTTLAAARSALSDIRKARS